MAVSHYGNWPGLRIEPLLVIRNMLCALQERYVYRLRNRGPVVNCAS